MNERINDRHMKVRPRFFQYSAWFLILLGVSLRFINLYDNRLWEDEIFSATVSQGPFLDMLVAILRHDVHPPLYYIQLYVWQLFGQSDVWLLLNSTFWSMFSHFHDIFNEFWMDSVVICQTFALRAVILRLFRVRNTSKR